MSLLSAIPAIALIFLLATEARAQTGAGAVPDDTAKDLATPGRQPPAENAENKPDYTPKSDLRGYEPTYLVYAFDDEDHLEFKISVKYPLFKSTIGWVGKWLGGSNQVYFSYTGIYDFFVFSDEAVRPSAPVISRLHNPGVFIANTRPLHQDGGLENISLGWFHESNGQQIKDNETFLNTANAQDFVSRGWDYLGLDLKFISLDPWYTSGSVNYFLRLKLFCNCQGFGSIGGKEDDIRIFGGTRTAEISDYDGLRFAIDNFAKEHWHYGLSFRSGTSSTDALKRISYQVEVTYRVSNLPVKLFYFNGYGKNISTYHIRDEYIGLGFEFW
jgi:hypothetical protein